MEEKKSEIPSASPVSPPKRKPLMIVAEEIYDYLHEYGASRVSRIARELNLDPLEVMKALKELEKQGKIKLQSLDLIIKHRTETSLKQTGKKVRDLKEPFDLAYRL